MILDNTTSKPAPHNTSLGILYMMIFSILWLSNPLFSTDPVNIIAGIIIVAIELIVILPPYIKLLRQAPDGANRLDNATNTKFGLIGAAEAIGIVAVIALCNNLHTPNAISGAVAIIVGLHFIPLARLFKMGLYNYTGAAIVAIGVIGLMFVNQLFENSITMYFVPYLTALVLFATSLRILREAKSAPKASM